LANGGTACGYRWFTVDYVISLERHRHGLLQLSGARAALYGYIDADAGSFLLAEVYDLVVRSRLTDKVVYRRGPLCGDAAQHVAAEVHWMIRGVGFEKFVARHGR
jgi:hypothetical protein